MKLIQQIAFASLVALAADAAGEEPRFADFHGTVDVAADGTIRVERLEGVQGALATAVRSQIEARRAIPAESNGVATFARAPLSGRVTVRPNGERLDVLVDTVRLQPSPTRRLPLNYPIDAIREGRAGWVEVEFALDGKGKPIDLRTVQASQPDFAKATLPVVAKWRFDPPDPVVGTRWRVGVTFQIQDHDSGRVLTGVTPAFECVVASTMPRMSDAPECADQVIVSGSRVRR